MLENVKTIIIAICMFLTEILYLVAGIFGLRFGWSMVNDSIVSMSANINTTKSILLGLGGVFIMAVGAICLMAFLYVVILFIETLKEGWNNGKIN